MGPLHPPALGYLPALELLLSSVQPCLPRSRWSWEPMKAADGPPGAAVSDPGWSSLHVEGG